MFKFVLYLCICVNFKGVYNVNWVIEWFIIFVDEKIVKNMILVFFEG